ncbi:Ddo [Phodopus roborovskii]|uniref:D-aspartate oxidase n=1 Tax=Phodopus roborovskii TaxID=109678 RepID=A0AAU9YSN8_PHORO|nr:Ddo [Phodopus roborovskii]
MDTVRIAVVGAGVIGLSTAMCISQLVPRCSVTVLSDKFTPETTSNVAAGMLIPHRYPVGRCSSMPPTKRCLSGLMSFWDFER